MGDTSSGIQGVNLEGLEPFFRFGNKEDAMSVLYRRCGMYMCEHDPAVRRFLEEMEKYDKPRLEGSPASENNLPKDSPVLNYVAPTRNLQAMLCEAWFDAVSADKKKYTKAWREELIAKLMKSEHKHDIAKTWDNEKKRLQLRGHVIGALIAAGAIREKALAVARIYYGTDEDTKETKTLVRYMGDSRKENFTAWVIDYVAKTGEPGES